MVNALILFEEATGNHAEATENGNYKSANKCYKTIARSIQVLKEQNGISKLLQCLDSDSIGVRIWAATYLLPLYEIEGIKVLSKIAEGTGIHSFDAQMTLNEWKKGNLNV